MEGQYFLTRIELDEKSVIHRSAQIEHERKIAIFDLLLCGDIILFSVDAIILNSVSDINDDGT